MDPNSNNKKPRYCELTSAAAEDPTLATDEDEVTLYVLLGHHAKENVLNCLTIRHKILNEHIVAIGPTTIQGAPAVEIYLKANGIGVAALKGKKFHDTSNRLFLTEDDLAAGQTQANEDVVLMISRVPYKLSTSKKALRDIAEFANSNLKYKTIQKIESVKDEEGRFNSKVRVVYTKAELQDVISETGQKDQKNWKACSVGFVLNTAGRVVVPDFVNNLNNRAKVFYQVDVMLMTDEFIFERELHAENNSRVVGVLPAGKGNNKRRKCIKCFMVKNIEAFCDRKLCPTICPRCSGKCENFGHCEKIQRSRKRSSHTNVERENWKKQWAQEAEKADYCYIVKFRQRTMSRKEISMIIFSIYRSKSRLTALRPTYTARQKQPNNTTSHFNTLHLHRNDQHLTFHPSLHPSNRAYSTKIKSPSILRVLQRNFPTRLQTVGPNARSVRSHLKKHQLEFLKNQEMLKQNNNNFSVLSFVPYYRHENQAHPHHRFS